MSPHQVYQRHWIGLNMHPEFNAEEKAEFNNAVNTQDLDAINAFIERLMPAYEQAVAESEVEQTTEETDTVTQIEEWYEGLSDEFIDEQVDQLYDQEFSSQDVELMSTLQTQYEPDSPHHKILYAGQQIANGVISIDEAIDLVTQEYGEAAAVAAYVELQHLINQVNE